MSWPMRKGILRQLESSHSLVSVKEMKGSYNFEPELHHSFLFYPSDPVYIGSELVTNSVGGGFVTSQIRALKYSRRGNKIKFVTQNSVYELEFLEGDRYEKAA